MVTHLETDILECEIKWALGSSTTNKATGGDGIPAELFKILKDDVIKILHSVCHQFGKFSSEEPVQQTNKFLKRRKENITMNKASGGYGIPAELFKILKDDPKRS